MGVRSALKHVQDAEPGTRFQGAFERHKIDNYAVRMGVIVLGFALMVAAAFTFWLPGPNFVLVLAGLAIIGAQSEKVSRWMDSGEMAGRRWHEQKWQPYRHKTAVKVIGALVIGAGALAIGLLALEQGWLPYAG